MDDDWGYPYDELETSMSSVSKNLSQTSWAVCGVPLKTREEKQEQRRMWSFPRADTKYPLWMWQGNEQEQQEEPEEPKEEAKEQ